MNTSGITIHGKKLYFKTASGGSSATMGDNGVGDLEVLINGDLLISGGDTFFEDPGYVEIHGGLWVDSLACQGGLTLYQQAIVGTFTPDKYFTIEIQVGASYETIKVPCKVA